MLIVFMNFAPNKIYYSANNIVFESNLNSICSFCCGGTLMKIMASVKLGNSLRIIRAEILRTFHIPNPLEIDRT